MMRMGLDDQVLKRDLAGARVTHGSGLKLHLIKALFFREITPVLQEKGQKNIDIWTFLAKRLSVFMIAGSHRCVYTPAENLALCRVLPHISR